MYLIFDTETSGLPKWDLPPNDVIQPYMLSIGLLLLDSEYKERASFYSLVNPEKEIYIDPKATENNGITLEDCRKYGVPTDTALIIFAEYCTKSNLVVAHNIKFDSFIIDIELCRQNETNGHYAWKEHSFCTMLAMTDICKLPGKNGKYKWPKLREAYQYFFPKRQPFKEHHAMEDVRACADVFRWYRQRSNIQEVTVNA